MIGATASEALAFGFQILAYAVARAGIGSEGLQFLTMVWAFASFIGYLVLPLIVDCAWRVHQISSIPS